jgi:hypothetical protein
VLSFIQKSGEMIDNYYPEQVARLVVCRAPRWFSTIWGVIARVLPEAVQKKVDILYDVKVSCAQQYDVKYPGRL